MPGQLVIKRFQLVEKHLAKCLTTFSLLREDYLYLYIIHAITFSLAFVVSALVNSQYEASYGLFWRKVSFTKKDYENC